MKTPKIILPILSLILFSNCNNYFQKEAENTNQLSKDQNADTCNLTSEDLHFTDRKSKHYIVSSATAIEFFNLHDKIVKYDSKNPDSLPDKLKHDGRQTIYKTIDQYGYYLAMIKPTLDSLNINILNGELKDSIITFIGSGDETSININWFKENDGVIFFKPGKKPVFWSAKNSADYINETNCVKSYYGI